MAKNQLLPKDEDAQNLAECFSSIREQTLRICEPLEAEDYGIQPIAFVSPPKWHLAHTTWFFEEFVLKKSLSNFKYYKSDFGLLFNSYYKSLGDHWLQQERGILSRPTLKEIRSYRLAIDQQVQELLVTKNLDAMIKSHLLVGLHHEQQHQELLYMDIKYILGLNQTEAIYDRARIARAKHKPAHWLSFDEGLYTIGHEGDAFSFDNELPRHKFYLYPFAISDVLVSNSDYLAFINSGAYNEARCWLSLGWDWLQRYQIKKPLYWKQVGDAWFEYTLYGLEELDLNAPVTHISYFEADAYARWQKARLPSEFEFEVFLCSQKAQPSRPQGLHPRSIAAARAQVWCWTTSAYAPYPRFKPFAHGLAEYNGKFMCNQMVLRGASVVTPEGHYRDSYRNFFLPEQRWMFSGIRLAKDLP